jgi:hypothetical protein
MKPKPTAEDWVIARLLKVIFDQSEGFKAYRNPDVVRSVLYLTKRLGEDQAVGLFDTLRKESK